MSSRRKVISLFSVILVLLSLVTVALAADVTDDSKQVTATQSDIEWASYTDPRFDFTIDYPASWHVVPRDDIFGVGATLAFTLVDPERTEEFSDLHDAPPKVEIGMYTVAWSERESLPGKSLKEWIDEYNKLSQGSDISINQVRQSRRIQVDRRDALYEEGKDISDFRYTIIPRGDIVWFIWSNVEEEPNITVYEQMVSSFQFGKNTPNTLQEAYGEDFKPFPLRRAETSAASQYNSELKRFTDIYALSSSWRVPLNGGPWQATCKSSAHNNNRSKYARDVGRPAWTEVRAAQQGDVTFGGWDNYGFGLLVKFKKNGGSKTAYNAHLAGIHEGIYRNWFVNKGQLIGWVGNTGNSTDYHLHFEVRDSANNGVNLVGMSGLINNTYFQYPGDPNPPPGSPPGTPPTGNCGQFLY